jgi:hypothetical protein
VVSYRLAGLEIDSWLASLKGLQICHLLICTKVTCLPLERRFAVESSRQGRQGLQLQAEPPRLRQHQSPADRSQEGDIILVQPPQELPRGDDAAREQGPQEE